MTQQYVPRQQQVAGRTTPQTVWNEEYRPDRPMPMGRAISAPQAGMGNVPNAGYNPPAASPAAPQPAGGASYGTQLAAQNQPGYGQQLNYLYAAGKAPGTYGNPIPQGIPGYHGPQPGGQAYNQNGYGGGGGQQTQGDAGLNAFMDRGPYNSLVDRGNQFIRNGIPTNAGNMMDSSPAFRGMNPGMSQSLNRQWNDRGGDLQNQAGLEFGRQAGVQIPQFLLQQMLGVKGLENDWFNLQNDQYRTGMNQQSGGINQILKLLGGMGNLF